MWTEARHVERRTFLRRLLRSSLLCALSILSLPWTATRAQMPAPHRPLIVFMSDFGELDDAVAICKGVMKTIAPDAEIIDLTHQVPAYSISDGSRLLARTSQ